LAINSTVAIAAWSSGLYESANEVIRAALRALDREEAAMDEIMRQKILASLADSRADIPAEDVFARLRAHDEEQLKGGRRHTRCVFGHRRKRTPRRWEVPDPAFAGMTQRNRFNS
jgi:antitoxin ParD1/3/4